LNGRRSRDEGELVVAPAREVALHEKEAQTCRSQELEPAQVEDDPGEAGLTQLVQLGLEFGGCRHVKLADRHHAHAIALGVHIDVKRDACTGLPLCVLDHLHASSSPKDLIDQDVAGICCHSARGMPDVASAATS
jgi:hypothetical protein